jgi:hypothetical protein
LLTSTVPASKGSAGQTTRRQSSVQPVPWRSGGSQASPLSIISSPHRGTVQSVRQAASGASELSAPAQFVLGLG